MAAVWVAVAVGAVVLLVMGWALIAILRDRRPAGQWVFAEVDPQRVEPGHVSTYDAEHGAILGDDGPFDWPTECEGDPEVCGCRRCHSDELTHFPQSAIDAAFYDMAARDPLLRQLKGMRGRRRLK